VTNDASERRRRARVPVRLAITVRLEGEEIAVESRDLSLKGLACTPSPLLQEIRCCQVVISLAPKIQAVIKGRVVRAGEIGAAIDFLATDLESFYHPRRSWNITPGTPRRSSRASDPCLSSLTSPKPVYDPKGAQVISFWGEGQGPLALSLKLTFPKVSQFQFSHQLRLAAGGSLVGR
jgi:hypothetical protein